MKKILECILFFPSVTKIRIMSLLGITLTAILFEGFGVAMLFPVMDFIERGKDFSVLTGSSRMWDYLGRVFDFFSIPVSLISLMSIVFVLLMVRQFFNYLRTIYNTWITESIFADVRTIGFKWFVYADMPFYDVHGVGQLINALTVDGMRAGGGIFTFFNMLTASMIFILYFVLLMALSPGMTLFAMGIMGCVGIILKSRIARSAEIGADVSRYNERISSAIVERLNGVKVLKVAATEKDEAELIAQLSEKIKKNTYALAKIRAKMEFVVDPMVILAGLIILYFSIEVFHMSLAKTGIFVFVLLRLMPYTKDIFYSRQGVAGFSGSLFRVKDLFEEAQSSKVIEGGNIGALTLTQGIRFENVSFCYNNDQEGFSLRNVNIFIPAAKMTALVGRSGAGKSTLVDLIPRLRTPVSGRITIDNVPIESFELMALRCSIAFVSQEGFLFNDSILRNIRYTRPDATDSEVREAAKLAYAHDFIQEFAKGYETGVGERGMRLSGGQKQRIILARALLQRASIIILDEPTSSLDSESEQKIQKAMEEIRRKHSTTIIVIAHRLSTIRSADQIIVLDRGRVIEKGTHGDLIQEGSWYADMVSMQALR